MISRGFGLGNSRSPTPRARMPAFACWHPIGKMMMKRFSLGCLVILLSAAASLGADENVRTVQTRLKAGGYYSGKVNGVHDSETATAITRYQIRNGLPITGKLDSQTRTALGVAAEKPGVPKPKFGKMCGVIFERATRNTSKKSWRKTPALPNLRALRQS